MTARSLQARRREKGARRRSTPQPAGKVENPEGGEAVFKKRPVAPEEKGRSCLVAGEGTLAAEGRRIVLVRAVFPAEEGCRQDDRFGMSHRENQA
jgi:hypothetical protein